MNDILPPKRPLSPQRPKVTMAPPPPPVPPVPPPSPPLVPKPEPPRKRRLWWIISGVLIVCVLTIVAIFVAWYRVSLQPVNTNDHARTRVQIANGSSVEEIARVLEQKKLIRSKLAFLLYTRVSGARSTLQAGTYHLSPSESTKAIVGHLASGKIDQITITFLPGATLAENKTVLVKAGYTETEIDTALSKSYNHPLFADKPTTADLEGYIYGETYHFNGNATVEEILTKTFDQYYKTLTQDGLIEAFKAKGLNLYQAVTLASIIQREVSGAHDQKQVAQVFFKRLSIGMELGADATYQYAAKKLNVPPSVDLESPYNTRKYPGIPPGPIAVPGRSALQAVASPAAGDYLYFVSGDDNKNYFAHTFEEHEANIRAHCVIKCSLP